MILAYRHIRVVDPTHPEEARRAAARLAEKVAFNEVRAAELSIIVMELANNVLAHAQSGEMLLVGWQHGPLHGIDIFAVDKGPGDPRFSPVDERRFMVVNIISAAFSSWPKHSMAEYPQRFTIYRREHGSTPLGALTTDENGNLYGSELGA